MKKETNHRLINTTKSVDDFLSTLSPKQFKQAFATICNLRKDPLPYDSIKLNGFQEYRTDVGEYRVIYTFDDNIVNVVIIGKKNEGDIYHIIKY